MGEKVEEELLPYVARRPRFGSRQQSLHAS
jgi:hypothetical protein